MRSTGYGGLLDCSWYDIENCLQQTESDFQRMGKLGGGQRTSLAGDRHCSRLFSLLGTYGDVFRVRHRVTGEIYALKQIRDEHEANGISATAMREASILKQLNHQNIIKLYDVFLTNERCYFLLEYMDEDLKRYLDKNRPLERQTIKVGRWSRSCQSSILVLAQNFMYQLLDAIFYCHKHRIIHRDIKPHNILVNSEGQVKLCDFGRETRFSPHEVEVVVGLARAFTIPMKIYTHEIVTLWYRAPEILLGSSSYGTPGSADRRSLF